MKHNINNEGKSNVAVILGSFAGVSLCILCFLIAVYLLKQKELADARAAQQAIAQTTQTSEVQSETETGTVLTTTEPETVYEDAIDADFYISSIKDDIFSRINGRSYNKDAPVGREQLRYVHILHIGVDGVAHEGELIVNEVIARDVLDIFYELYQIGYVLESVVLVDEYGADDNASMAVNNTSGFNARKVAGTEVWSNHAYGLAIDINPLYNPYVGESDTVLPATARQYTDRSLEFDMKLDAGDECCRIFAEHGFTWGGDWENVKDYMHFEKQPDSVLK